MASGIWNENDRPTIPGSYHRLRAAAQNRLKRGEYGVLAMPVKSNWGPVGEFVAIKNEKELKSKFGDNKAFTVYRLGKLALLGLPKELLLYRLVDGNEKCSSLTLKDTASSSVDVLKIESKYPTTRDFNLTVRTSIVDEDKKDLILFEGTKVLYTFSELTGTVKDIVNKINNNSDNQWIKATIIAEGNSLLSDIVNKRLLGGNDGVENITNETYVDALNKFEGNKFNGFCLDGYTDQALNLTIKSWEQRLRESGMNIICYFGCDDEESIANANSKSKVYNFEGIAHNATDAYYEGERYTPAEVACYIAAVATGQTISESICNYKTIFTDVGTKLTPEQQKSALAAGTIIMIKENDNVIIVDDVNTFKKYNEDKTETWGFIRAIKFMDAVSEDTGVGSQKHLGRTINNRNGQLSILSGYKQYFEEYVKAGVIDEDFIVTIDEELQVNAKSDEFFWMWDAKYVNVVKRIYGTGYVR